MQRKRNKYYFCKIVNHSNRATEQMMFDFVLIQQCMIKKFQHQIFFICLLNLLNEFKFYANSYSELNIVRNDTNID